MKKIAMTLITVLMMISMTVIANAASVTYEGLVFNPDSGTITDCEASVSGEVVIPDTIEGVAVTRIGSNAFSYCTGITSVVVPDSVRIIYFSAFEGCSNLKSIKLSQNLDSMGATIFRNCTSLTDINIPDSVDSIGNHAFEGCIELEGVVIPANVESIGLNIFHKCPKITKITVDSENPYYTTDSSGVLYNKDKTELIKCQPGNEATVYSIPDGVQTIRAYAFYECDNFTEITIPDSVSDIGEGAFEGCSALNSIKIPDKVKTIEGNIFKGCSALNSVNIPDEVDRIEAYAFHGCSSLTEIKLPDSVTWIEQHAFYNCS